MNTCFIPPTRQEQQRMANEEHLTILRQGVEAWNAWRAANRDVMPNFFWANFKEITLHEANLSSAFLGWANLREADLQGSDLQGAYLQEAYLLRANLQKVNLQGANLNGSVLQGANLQGANMSHARLSKANLSKADLRSADLRSADFYEANLSDTNLRGADLHEADLVRVNLNGSDLQGANLRKSKLGGAELQEANLQEVNLQEVNLKRANLREAHLHEANLQEADLGGAVLSGANLRGTNLRGTNLAGAILQRTVLDGANLTDARAGATTFGHLDLRNVQGLDTIQHHGPSTIGIDTLYQSHGDIPEVFLRGCGVPDSMIEYARALVAAERPIDYYSVFISYSSKDEALAKRLYADLQAAGVRCWYAPHDLEIGEPILSGIDRGIRLHDKLLLILSAASVESAWIEQEVQMALARERTERRPVLFPIRIDDAVSAQTAGWPALVWSQRHVGDFRGWKQHDAYQQAFQRLLRDLKADKGG